METSSPLLTHFNLSLNTYATTILELRQLVADKNWKEVASFVQQQSQLLGINLFDKSGSKDADGRRSSEIDDDPLKSDSLAYVRHCTQEELKKAIQVAHNSASLMFLMDGLSDGFAKVLISVMIHLFDYGM